MGRIALKIDPDIDANFPNRRAAIVTIETKDGRVGRHLQQTRKGDPDMPLTDGDLEEKYLELTEPVIGRSKAASLLERLWRLESQDRLDLY
jgi:2-methylcitrate dehydratase PrpD